MYNNSYQSYNNYQQKGYSAQYQQPVHSVSHQNFYTNNSIDSAVGYNELGSSTAIPSYQQKPSYHYHHQSNGPTISSTAHPTTSVSRNEGLQEACVDLKSHAIALYFEKLLQWGKKAFQQHYPQANFLSG